MFYSLQGDGDSLPLTVQTDRELTQQELDALQNAASSIGQSIQQGLSVTMILVGAGVGLAAGYLIWGRES